LKEERRGKKVKTGVFFHSEFSLKDWPIIGNKYRNFPRVMEKALSLEGVKLFESKPVPEDLLLRVHTESYLKDVKKAWYYQGARLAVGGCVEASEKIAKGELINALVFAVAAGHHAEPSSAWGGTYLSCAGPAVAHVRDLLVHRRFAIIDTDSHHGNGTRAVFRNDPEVLHVCFCDDDTIEGNGTKIDVDAGYRTSDPAYLEKVQTEFFERVRRFRPFMIYHNFGHDTCEGDYGDRGLSRSFFLRLAEEVKHCAEEVCEGRYLIITHGGYLVEVAEYIFPRIVEILARP
jgi:acetoin utilization deacetylase AcuC-like enzyme